MRRRNFLAGLAGLPFAAALAATAKSSAATPNQIRMSAHLPPLESVQQFYSRVFQEHWNAVLRDSLNEVADRAMTIDPAHLSKFLASAG